MQYCGCLLLWVWLLSNTIDYKFETKFLIKMTPMKNFHLKLETQYCLFPLSYLLYTITPTQDIVFPLLRNIFFLFVKFPWDESFGFEMATSHFARRASQFVKTHKYNIHYNYLTCGCINIKKLICMCLVHIDVPPYVL